MPHFVSEINIAAVTLTENVGVISGLSFKMCIRDSTLRSKAERVKREACRRLRVDSRGMIDKVGLETRFFNLFHRHVARQLMHDRRDHLQMGKFFRSQRSIGNVPMYQI